MPQTTLARFARFADFSGVARFARFAATRAARACCRPVPSFALALIVGLFAVSISAPAMMRAQDAASRDAQEAAPQTPAPAQSAAPAAAPARPAPPRTPAQNVNVAIDITITDQAGSNPPIRKTLNVIAADRESGSIRSKVELPLPRPSSLNAPGSMPVAYSYVSLPLNVDIRPELVEGGRIRARLILNYQTTSAPKAGSSEPHSTSEVTATVIAVLENGKPLVVSQSADAATDRKVIVELKATILK